MLKIVPALAFLLVNTPFGLQITTSPLCTFTELTVESLQIPAQGAQETGRVRVIEDINDAYRVEAERREALWVKSPMRSFALLALQRLFTIFTSSEKAEYRHWSYKIVRFPPSLAVESLTLVSPAPHLQVLISGSKRMGTSIWPTIKAYFYCSGPSAVKLGLIG